jgi:four helix bundle protein
MTTGFKTLRVYKLAETLADEIWAIIADWPLFAKNTLGEQLVRAADSIGANIAEGSGRYYYKDNKRFVRIARGSLYETQHWLRRSQQRKLLTSEQIHKLQPIVDQLGPGLNRYLASIGKTKTSSPQDPEPGPSTPVPSPDAPLQTTDPMTNDQ